VEEAARQETEESGEGRQIREVILSSVQAVLFCALVSFGLFGFGYWLKPRAEKVARFVWFGRKPSDGAIETIVVVAKFYMLGGVVAMIVVLVSWARGKL
jgi:hypothetical protein